MMENYEFMIREYGEQTIRLRERIGTLSTEITDAQKTRREGKAKLLSDRRQILYQELWEMEQSIRKMRNYIQSVRERRERLKQ